MFFCYREQVAGQVLVDFLGVCPVKFFESGTSMFSIISTFSLLDLAIEQILETPMSEWSTECHTSIHFNRRNIDVTHVSWVYWCNTLSLTHCNTTESMDHPMMNNQFHRCASPDSAFQRLHGGGHALESLRMVGFWLSHLYHLCWFLSIIRFCRLQVNVLIFWCGDFEWVFMPSSSPVLTVLDSQANERDEEWQGRCAGLHLCHQQDPDIH